MNKKLVDTLKKEGFSFEEIQKIQERIESVENGTAKFINHEEFWDTVAENINAKMMENV